MFTEAQMGVKSVFKMTQCSRRGINVKKAVQQLEYENASGEIGHMCTVSATEVNTSEEYY